MEKLFVYGTLRVPEIRNKIAGREIASGGKDFLSGFRLSTIGDGNETYPIIIEEVGITKPIEGEILEVTAEELLKLDEYEGDWFVRRKVKLKSGTKAWVYSQ
jgi:gamma-glutamylcyclotransferase (GGCT)/AIG2-like uncharacterized protein YtfP